jgi:hypothetical protein
VNWQTFTWKASSKVKSFYTARLSNPVFHSLRSRPVVASTAESYQRDAELYSDRSLRIPCTHELMARAEYLHNAELRSDQQGNNSISSFPSSISAPTRDWVSAAGPQHSLQVQKYAVNAVEYRVRSCHFFFNPAHFPMDCPLLGMEILQLAQQQSDQKSGELRARRKFTAFLRSVAHPPISPSLAEPRTALVAVGPLIDEVSSISEIPINLSLLRKTQWEERRDASPPCERTD